MRTFTVCLLFIVALVFPASADVKQVASVDYASNASNLSTGTVSVSRLPVGTTSTTGAAGNDVRFDSLPIGRPDVSAGSSRVLVWVE